MRSSTRWLCRSGYIGIEMRKANRLMAGPRLRIRPTAEVAGTVVDLDERRDVGRAGGKLSSMKILTYEGLIERGRSQTNGKEVKPLSRGVEDLLPSMIQTPRLLRPDQTPDFAMEIMEGEEAAVR